MQRMRTLDQIYEYIKAQDPDTCLTKSGLYRLVRSGEIPCVYCGKKRLVAIESVEAYLFGGQPPQPEPVANKPELQCVKGV